jgi:phenylacetate-coenzyme A ligase PaaK-like adenylate-forming protein
VRLGYHAKRLADVTGGLREARLLAEGERWPRERIERHQREGVDAIVRHAVAESPFYRERLEGLVGPSPVELSALPALDKTTMMERFDEVVTDRRLRRDELLEHLETLTRDELYLGRHRVMTTSGSSGQKGLFVYDREAWRGICAMFFRHTAMAGIRPRLPRLRMAMIGGGAPTHMSRRGAATLRVGLHRVLPLSVTMPIPLLVRELNAFRPDFVYSYPSVAALLADEQLAGRLRIAPAAMSTSSELRTPEMTARIVEAFGVHPTDFYATTEGLWGSECEEEAGIHVFEDMAVLENVDEHGRAVPDGERGARLLVTNLFNRVQPLIRLEVSDVVVVDPTGCPCGRSLRRILAIEGRADDVIWLRGDGRTSPSTRSSSRSSPPTETSASSRSCSVASGSGFASACATARPPTPPGGASASASPAAWPRWACGTPSSRSRPARGWSAGPGASTGWSSRIRPRPARPRPRCRRSPHQAASRWWFTTSTLWPSGSRT